MITLLADQPLLSNKLVISIDILRKLPASKVQTYLKLLAFPSHPPYSNFLHLLSLLSNPHGNPRASQSPFTRGSEHISASTAETEIFTLYFQDDHDFQHYMYACYKAINNKIKISKRDTRV